MKETPLPSADTALMRKPGPKGRAILAVSVAVLTLVVGLSIASAATSGGWPTTCVELNDIIESNRGNLDRVGIYQRAHGDQAEQACQNDHRAQIQASFAWIRATPTAATIPTQAPIATPAPSRHVTGPPTAPLDLRVARSGRGYIISARPPADGGGQNLLGYRWTVVGAATLTGVVASSGGGFSLRLDELQHGDYEVTVIAFNASGDSPTAVTRISSPACRIEVGLIEDWQGSVLVSGRNTGNQRITNWTVRHVIHGSGRGPWPANGGRVAVGQTETVLLWYRSASNLGPAPHIELLDGGHAWCSGA